MRPVPVVSTPLWRESWSIMRCRVFVLFAMLGFLAMAAPAKAQEGPSAHPTECAEFTNQAAAQTYFDAQGADYQNFDADGNGIACDEAGAFESGGPSAGPEGPSAHPTECAEFTNQTAAQTYFDAQGADYQNFDADGNGVACDEADTSNSGSATADSSDKADSVVSALPTTGSGPMSETNAVVIALIGAATLLAGCAAMAVRRMKIGTA